MAASKWWRTLWKNKKIVISTISVTPFAAGLLFGSNIKDKTGNLVFARTDRYFFSNNQFIKFTEYTGQDRDQITKIPGKNQGYKLY